MEDLSPSPAPETEEESPLPELEETEEPAGTAPPSGRRDYNLGFVLAFTFILGLSIGFLGRPALLRDLPIEVVVTVVPNSDSQAVAQASEAITTAPIQPNSPASTPTPPAPTDEAAGEAGPTPTIMDFVLSDARHFDGDDGSPVTIVEFSDFK